MPSDIGHCFRSRYAAAGHTLIAPPPGCHYCRCCHIEGRKALFHYIGYWAIFRHIQEYWHFRPLPLKAINIFALRHYHIIATGAAISPRHYNRHCHIITAAGIRFAAHATLTFITITPLPLRRPLTLIACAATKADRLCHWQAIDWLMLLLPHYDINFTLQLRFRCIIAEFLRRLLPATLSRATGWIIIIQAGWHWHYITTPPIIIWHYTFM